MADGLSIDLNQPITLDLSEVSTEPVSVGWHTVTIERAEAKLTRQKELPSIFVMARITDEADADHNRTVIWNTMLAGDGLMFTKKFFQALGLPEQLDYPSYQALAEDLLGREVDVKVKHRSYEGEKQANATDWREPELDIVL